MFLRLSTRVLLSRDSFFDILSIYTGNCIEALKSGKLNAVTVYDKTGSETWEDVLQTEGFPYLCRDRIDRTFPLLSCFLSDGNFCEYHLWVRGKWSLRVRSRERAELPLM